MAYELLQLPPAARLRALRKLDIFHRWLSIDEKRLCRRCGAVISGREILILSARQDQQPAHLECPTPGCLAVPLDWIMVEAEPDSTAERSEPRMAEQLPPSKPLQSELQRFALARIFRFLRAPRIFFL